VVFYKPSKEDLLSPRGRGERFTEVVEKFYPSEDSDKSFAEGEFANLLYQSARNPLAHSLGLDPTSSKGKIVVLKKWPLSTAELLELEDSVARPAWAHPSITKRDLSDGSTELVISIPTLYWGLHRMLHALFSTEHVIKAEALAREYRSIWNRYVIDHGIT